MSSEERGFATAYQLGLLRETWSALDLRLARVESQLAEARIKPLAMLELEPPPFQHAPTSPTLPVARECAICGIADGDVFYVGKAHAFCATCVADARTEVEAGAEVAVG